MIEALSFIINILNIFSEPLLNTCFMASAVPCSSRCLYTTPNIQSISEMFYHTWWLECERISGHRPRGCMSSFVENVWFLNCSFNFGNTQKSRGARSELYGKCGNTLIFLPTRYSNIAFAVRGRVL